MCILFSSSAQGDAMGLLTSVPGKTGYVVINRKQCEVKASTPKTGDNSSPGQHHHHQAGGLWRPNHPPYHHYRNNARGGYIHPHRPGMGAGVGGREQQAVAPHAAATSSPTVGPDDRSPQQHRPSSQGMVPIYQPPAPPMNAYGRIYNPNYPPMYPPPGGVYQGGGAGAAPIVHLPYGAPSYAPMGQGRGNGGGYYNPYPYGQYGNNVGYVAHHGGHNNADGGSVGGGSVPSQSEVEYGLGYYEFAPQQPYPDLSSEDSYNT